MIQQILRQIRPFVLGWIREYVYRAGATADRPASPVTGQMFFDTTLGTPIWWNGSNWIDASGTTV
jgi:hypothetical protein